MNNNIFSPKGSISQSFFLLYYILLTTIYIIGGIALFVFVYKYALNPFVFIIPLVLIKILIAFNFKKRIFAISKNVIWAWLLGAFLTFDVEGVSVCQSIKDPQVSIVTFFALLILTLFILPAIVALIPSKSQKDEN